MKKLLIATSALMSMVISAQAADISPRAYTKAAAPVPHLQNWSGLYVGAFGGYGVNRSQGADIKGGFGGANLSYLRQTGAFVYGADVEVAGAGMNQTVTFAGATGTAKIDTFGSVTARVGVAVDKALIYGKVGYGWTNMKLAGNVGALSGSDSKTTGGVAAGAGVEYAVAPQWSVKGEYLWQRLDGKAYFNGTVPVNSTDLQTVKFGVNYHFAD